MQRFTDAQLIGFKAGRLTVEAIVGRTPAGKRRVKCRCECGGETVVVISDMRNGHIKSCGCLHAETARANMKRVRHLGQNNRLRHGRTNTPEYYIWRTMKARCLNPKCSQYPWYGGRGISICDRWMTFDNFFADMGCRTSPKHQLDRIDNDGHYAPENCRWATTTQQSRNRSNSVLLTHNGETLTITDWDERLGLVRGTIANRLKKGWSLPSALATTAIPRPQRFHFTPT